MCALMQASILALTLSTLTIRGAVGKNADQHPCPDTPSPDIPSPDNPGHCVP